jgi:hypothetical protein
MNAEGTICRTRRVSIVSESANERRLDPLVLRAGWEFIERGWWTHDLLGGVVSEGRKWECYPLDLKDDAPVHSEPTRVAAMKWIEDRYTQNAGGQIPPASGGNLDRLVGHSES